MTALRAGQAIKVEKITNDHIARTSRAEAESLIEAGADLELVTLVELEAQGGNCPRCRKPWRKIEVFVDARTPQSVKEKAAKFPVKIVQLAEFEYYVPDCGCYTVCKRHFVPAMDWNKRKGRWEPIKYGGAVMGCGGSKHREDVMGITRCLSCGHDPAAIAKREEEADDIEAYKKGMGL